MTNEMDVDWLDEMNKDAAAARERTSGGGFRDRWSLSGKGKDCIVKSGHEVMVRLLPHPHVKEMIKDGKPNKEYKPKRIYKIAREHWFDDHAGKRRHIWCPKSIDPAAPCPLCETAHELLDSTEKTDREAGKQMRAKEVVLFNAVVGPPNNRLLVEEGERKGRVDVRLLPVPQTVFIGISELITGGETKEFRRGDISNVQRGYEVKLKRPPEGAQGVQWAVGCAPNPNPIFDPKDKATMEPWGPFSKEWPLGEWVKELRDPEAYVKDAILSYSDIKKMLDGKPGEPSEPSPEREQRSDPGNGFFGGDDTKGESEDKKDDAGWSGFGMPE